MLASIDFGRTGLVIDGEPHGMPVTISHLRFVLGVPRRTVVSETHEEYAWDDLGFSVRTRAETAYAEWATVFVRSGTVPNWPQDPTSAFAGLLSVDGAPIADVPFRVGYGGGRYALIGPFLLLANDTLERGHRYEYSIAIPEFDYFAEATS